jgi:cell division septation protein DedD
LDPHEHEPSYYEVALTNRQVVIGFVALLACVFTAFLAGVWLGRDAAPSTAARIAEAGESGAPALDADARRGRRMPKLTFFGEDAAAGAATEESRRGTAANRKRAGDGRKGGEPAAAPAAPAGATEAPGLVEVDEPAADPASESMRRTLEAEMEAHRDSAGETDPAAPAAEPEAEVPLRPGERIQRAPAAAAPSPAPVRAPSTPVEAPRAAAPAPASGSQPAAAPAAAPSAPAAAAPKGTASAPFWIQVYSSSNGARAREIAASLTRSGFGVRVLEVGTTYRVRVGPYANRDLADASARRLRREQKLDTWVTDQP